MTDHNQPPTNGKTGPAQGKPETVSDPEPSAKPRFEDLPPAAQRALTEAKERRESEEAARKARETEKGGPSGPEPTRYGDWERKGRAVDFS
ncbi:MAG: DUF1674 domain-containing protein [Pseudomonadota bacterium]